MAKSVIESITASTFNWTKVELKPSFFQIDRAFFVAFNWTKVELKLGVISKQIEDLKTFLNTFNWTKVELKLVLLKKSMWTIMPFNWTKVELKLATTVNRI